jgi:hypothetical protein
VQAEFFQGDFVKYNRFKKLAAEIKLEERLHLEVIEREMFAKNPVLILVDIGGSLMYRHSCSTQP